MHFREIATFDVVHGKLEWPWIAFSPDRTQLAFMESTGAIASRRLEAENTTSETSFALPVDIAVTAFAIAPAREDVLAVAGTSGDGALVTVLSPSGERCRARLDTIVGADHELRGLTFDRTGKRIWLSLESTTETVTALVDATSLACVGIIRTAAFPRPALHEIHVHPQDDAVLVVAACGEEGTFARVVGFAGDEVSSIPSELDGGGVAAGFVGFSADAARVHLVEADELRTHAWPTLHELSSVQLADDFVSSYSGAVIGDEIFVDGEDAETNEDMVMVFDRSAIHGVVLPPPAPIGMWAGRLGPHALVTVESKGDPVRARVLVRASDGPTKVFGGKKILS